MSFWKRNKPAAESFTEMNEIFSRQANSINFVPRPGFKEALFARLESARHATSMSKVSFRALFFSGRRAFATVGVTALVVVVIATIVFQPFYGVKTVFAQDNFVLTAEDSDSLGVETSSSFVLESKNPVAVSDIEDLMDFSIDSDVKFDQISDKKIRLTFSEDLPTAEVITFTLPTQIVDLAGETLDRPYHWAFQVKSTFKVANTIPGNRTTEVALDSGIEVNFNYENISLKDFEKAFSITPSLKGHFEQSRKTFVFVPEDGLQARTVYTAIIDGDLGLKGSDDKLGQDYVFTFETSDDTERGADFWIDERYLSVVPSEKIAVPFSSWRNFDGDENIHVEVKQFVSKILDSDYQQYLTAFKKSRENEWSNYLSFESVVDAASMPTVMTFDSVGTEAGWQKYLFFPETLPRGYYLADFSYAGLHRFALIQSSQVTAYTAKSVNETLVWVNSAETNGPISDAAVQFVGFEDQSEKTDKNGMASIPVEAGMTNEEYALRDLLEVRSGSEAIVLPLETSYRMFFARDSREQGSPILSASQNYWTYLYTDRPMYQMNDTVKFWGYLEHRDSGKKPESLRVVFSQGSNCTPFGCFYNNSSVESFDEVEVEVSDTGIFTGELELKNIPAGRYQVGVQLGEENVVYQDVTVSEYVKPAYTLSIIPDTDATWVGDTVGYTVHGEFFEGTPVKSLKVKVDTDSGLQELILDEAGNARGSFKAQENHNNRYPITAWLQVEPARPEEAGIEASSSVIVFGPKVYLDYDGQTSGIENSTGTIKIISRNVQAINSWDPEIFAPIVRPNQIVTGTLTELTYKQIEIGTTYDFIRKQVIKQYDYEKIENKIADVSLITDENGEATYTFAATNSEANYYLELSARDENGMADELTAHVWQKSTYENCCQPYLYFKNTDASEDTEGDFAGYHTGDQVNLKVVSREEDFVIDNNDNFLFFRAQRGIQERDLQNSVNYSFTFEAKDIPEISVFGVFFNGSAYAEVNDYGYGSNGYTINFDNSQKEINISLQTDKENYRPGDDVEVAVVTTDLNDHPVAAEVNLNVVDEAFYALMNEEVDPLNDLYGYVDNGVIATKSSSRMVESVSAGAEKGGGGERGRVDFKDMAAFAVISTDKNGQAIYVFTMPDNITSWRLTAQAIDPENKMAGDTKINLDSTLPFFVVPVMRDSYLVDDGPIVLLRAAGTDVGSGSSVEYEINVWDVEKKETQNALVSETARFVLPKLSEGPHEITITGSSEGLKDTVTRTVDIVKSRLVEPVVSSVELNGETTLSGSVDGLTYVTFVDAGRGQYYPELERLYRTFGDRADEAVTRKVSGELLNEYFNETNSVSEIAGVYQENGIRLIEYGDEDFDLSVKVAMLGGAPFNQGRLINYFSNYLYSSEKNGVEIGAEEAVKAYAALAGLGEPVLSEVQRMSQEEELNTNTKIYLALAMDLSGDGEGARVIYRELSKDLVREYGYAYLPNQDMETQGEQTVLMAILAGSLLEEDRDVLYDYVSEQNHYNTLLVLDQVLFLKETLKNLTSQNAEVQYTFEGESRSVSLENGQTLTLPLSVDELNSLKPVVEKGKAVAISRYDQPMLTLDDDTDSELKLTRKYSVVDGSVGTTFTEGDLIRVEITYDVPLSGKNLTTPFETFEITDVVPSGLSVVQPYWRTNGCQSWSNSMENQRISFFVSNEKQVRDTCGLYTLTYYARVVTTGTYVAEPTFIRSTGDPSDYNYLNESAIITIK
ncbi:MAG: Alpha-2-macroglobulin domain protein [Candidatus Uhrbacteria bacterium GW2011_GWE2_45_35]|uniref:Alpha-2-macroglobulin domain protein n=2 Tax=Candidatus Uhriibacteriota TaxID=1752732 RepID=A0A0G1JG96_9BACT|nr:MAG: Alpha-2-macroglobulin domain protein [Candidatus Uhrbacteria bacterium GW2011_GWF2_44_350]KKU08983.1 MAG: Alpha-2-macroglobulin domain protein [Candidatus Uhrbacteria bacterium GW2011_GWE2_45_35]HBR81071.1 hypothetical protein [Candidatus Uhrbacteria bacterium]HCU31261.1 hypothetical protein [Candidatus Uhrbacteria bacterium]